MARADFSTPRSLRIGVIAAVLLIHVAVIFGLIRALSPDFSAMVENSVLAAFTVPEAPKPPPPPQPAPTRPTMPDKAGAAGAVGKKALPKEVAAPKPKIVIAQMQAPQAASTGSAERSGAGDAGQGAGAGGQGAGTGAGGSGNGQGGGATKAVKIAGDINSARDYPREGRDLRIGDHVIVALTVGTDGRVKGCRVVRPSRDPQADKVTCDLASARFRFRPARDAAGNPVVSIYGWQQRWFYPGQK